MEVITRMNIAFAPKGTLPFRSPEDALGIARSALANRVLTVAGDVTFIIDADNIIRDVALGSNSIGEQWVPEWLDKPWIETVTIESRPKITQLLEQARSDAQPRWRQVNHISDIGEIPVRFLTLSADDEGRVIAIGRDMRAEAMLQQRLLQAQQSIERDYVKMRQAESRYRMLFELSSEAVLVVETGTRRIADANPAACAMVATTAKSLTGQPVSNIFARDSRDTAIALLGSVAAAEQAKPVVVRLSGGDAEFSMAASLFRQDRGSCFLVRLVARDVQMRMMEQTDRPLFDVLDNMPDGFVVTDEALNILAENAAFLDMVQVPRKEQVRGQPLGRFLGRPGIDLNLLIAQLREHGAARNFATVLRGLYNEQDEVEVSAVSVSDGGADRFGFSIRVVARRLAAIPAPTPGLAHSVEQMTELVGRVPLKEIVRESTDLIERLCIEAALAFTADNRASAAEILGLSRQSLYSKLHRHGLGNLGDDSSGD